MLKLQPQFELYADSLPSLSPIELERLEIHFRLLQEWNVKINLVSRKSIQTSFAYHYADSLFISEKAKPFVKDLPVIDIGTGAGFPGIIFSIRNPERKVSLFEKIQKKHLFLNAVLFELKLPHFSLHGGVVENLPRAFFFCRAVFPHETFFDFFKRRATPGSLIVMNSGGREEPRKLPEGFVSLTKSLYALPEEAGTRKIEIVQFVPRETK